MANLPVRTVPLEIRGNLRKFFTMKDPEIILDGPAGSGKTRILLERQHVIMCKYPGARGLITRKYRSSMNETCLQVLDKEVYADRDGKPYADAPRWYENDQKYIYANGAEIIVGGMDDPTKIMSAQYDWAYWNEAIEGKQQEWETISTRLRNYRVPYQQLLGDTNPGAPHHWIKQRADSGRLKLLPTNHKDNPVYWDKKHAKWTAKGNAYVNNILRDGLTGVTKARLYDGEWKAASGLVYDMWDRDIHVVPGRTIPDNWERIWVFDFGFVDPFVWIELCIDPTTGYVYLTREFFFTGVRVDQAAEYILKTSKGVVPYALICDHDAEDRATLEVNLGMLTVPAFKSINVGIQYVQNRLRTDNPRFHGKPGFYIFENSAMRIDEKLKARHKPTRVREEFDVYVWDTAKINEDKYTDEPVDKDNHGMDAVRYGLCFIDDASIDPQDSVRLELFNDDDYADDFNLYGDGRISLY
jgi:hypothetical protein